MGVVETCMIPLLKDQDSRRYPMSQNYHQGIYNFSNTFERSQPQHQQQQQQQIHQEKLRDQGFHPPPPLIGIEGEEEPTTTLPVYETAGMLSEMFSFPSATELLDNQISQTYRNPRPTGDWFLHRQGSAANADSAAAMHLFLMNPHQQRSPSHSPTNQQTNPSTLHKLLPHSSSASSSSTLQPFQEGAFGHFDIPGVVEGHGLSLSLSSSLQNLEVSKAEEMLFFGQGSAHEVQYQLKNLGVVSVLRNSKYSKAAQELLEEFCSVGRGVMKKKRLGNPSSGGGIDAIGGVNNSSSSCKDFVPLSATDRLEHQRRKVKLISMLEEVDRRYHHYCEQMQMVVNSFDMVMGFGAAVPYTCLAQKAMSRHFRCLKDAILAQLKNTCESLGEKDAGSSGLTKGETPRLKVLDQNMRQQRAFHQMGLMEQEAWRPQRGLPERSVNILRAWLFEHFLHPYPSDADKHLLARQTGLSRNQVSNWFINARVRLWKPMVEEMYQQEAKDIEPDEERDHNTSCSSTAAATEGTTTNINAQFPTTTSTPPPENDPSFIAINSNQSFPPTSALNNVRFGSSSGDVLLTLGLRQAGNLSEKSPFFS